MPRFAFAGAQRLRDRMAAIEAAPPRQYLAVSNPTISPQRRREIALARRTDAAQRRYWLERRGGEEDFHARWVRTEIAKLLEEADEQERLADELEAADAAP